MYVFAHLLQVLNRCSSNQLNESQLDQNISLRITPNIHAPHHDQFIESS